MYIYLIERKGFTGYDEHDGFVIAANSPREARKIAAEEGTLHEKEKNIWTSGTFSKVECLAPTRPGVILKSFLAG